MMNLEWDFYSFLIFFKLKPTTTCFVIKVIKVIVFYVIIDLFIGLRFEIHRLLDISFNRVWINGSYFFLHRINAIACIQLTLFLIWYKLAFFKFMTQTHQLSSVINDVRHIQNTFFRTVSTWIINYPVLFYLTDTFKTINQSLWA